MRFSKPENRGLESPDSDPQRAQVAVTYSLEVAERVRAAPVQGQIVSMAKLPAHVISKFQNKYENHL